MLCGIGSNSGAGGGTSGTRISKTPFLQSFFVDRDS